jgi:hypothetical protein
MSHPFYRGGSISGEETRRPGLGRAGRAGGRATIRHSNTAVQVNICGHVNTEVMKVDAGKELANHAKSTN